MRIKQQNQRLLGETDLPIKTIAYLAGFTIQERLRVMYSRRQRALRARVA